jgi:hypothetical protein
LVSVIGLILYIASSSRYPETNTPPLKTGYDIYAVGINDVRGISTRNTLLSEVSKPDEGVIPSAPFAVPLRNDGVYFPRDAADVRGTVVTSTVPINITTRGPSPRFTQVGALYVDDNHNDTQNGEVLPLMGRPLVSGGGDKWQYYTTSNRGIFPVSLSLKVNGKKSTMNEYGIDRLYSGDEVTVDGFSKNKYKVDVYENSTFRYIA